MAQADCIITAIRELMSRGRPPKSTSPVRAAHTELVAALAGNPPNPICADLDSEDLDGRADHLEKVFAALHGLFHRDRLRHGAGHPMCHARSPLP
jgi:hypothetical protein